MGNLNIDVTKNIKTIEWLKSELLNSVANLHASMLTPLNGKASEESLCSLLILTYMLSDKLGISQNVLDTRTVSAIKLVLINSEESSEYKQKLLAIAKHLENR